MAVEVLQQLAALHIDRVSSSKPLSGMNLWQALVKHVKLIDDENNFSA